MDHTQSSDLARSVHFQMDPYLFCMGLGFFGLFAMLALGFGHSGGHGHDHGGGGHLHDTGGHSGHAAHALHTGGDHGTHSAPAHHGSSDHGSFGRDTLFMLLAPRVWFSLLFGFGAIGTLLSPLLSGYLLGVAAFVGAWIFERWMVQPVWNFVLRFASNPARTLESAMLEDAVALTNFDAQGQGLISVNLDGQLRQMLGTLQKSPTEAVGRIRAGEKLIIVGVDSRRNSCTVARKGYSPEQLSQDKP